jgi:hypothetical protein
MLLQPVDVAPSLKPTDGKGVPKVMDAEPSKTGTLDVLIGKNAPHRLVKIRGHLNIRLAVGVFKEMARSTSASQWVQHPSGVSRWRDEGDDPWTVRLGLSQPDSSIYPIYLPVF